jgi:hypothetical protein
MQTATQPADQIASSPMPGPELHRFNLQIYAAYLQGIAKGRWQGIVIGALGVPAVIGLYLAVVFIFGVKP